MVASTHDTICMQLASVASAISHSPLPEKIVEEVRLCLLDFLTSTLAAPMTPMIAETATLFGDGPARLLHTEAPISVAGATFVHGFLSTVEDIDDAHALASGMHLSATTFPAILALAQSLEFSGAIFLRAAIAGYEIAGRLCRSMDEGLRARGFHASGAIGPFASCVAAGIILRLDREQMVHAFGIAASGAGGTFAFQTTGADSRHMHAANAGVVGLTAAMAAKNGATGPITAFEGPDGFIGSHSETCDREFIDSPAPTNDSDYEILNVYHKLFSACGHAIPAITLALDLRQNRPLPTAQIERIKIYGYRASARLVTFPTSTVSEAKFSLPVIFSLAYLYGDVSPKEMKTDVIQRPDVQALASKIEVYESASHTSALPRIRSGSVEIVRQDGQTDYLSTKVPIGMRGNRLTIENILRKFDVFTTLTLERARSESIVSRVMALNDTKTGYAVF